MTTFIPRDNVPIIDPSGKCNAQWYKFFEAIGLSDSGGGGSGTVQSVNKKLPDTNGNVQINAGDVGADPAGTALQSMAAHLAASNPHPQYASITYVDSELSEKTKFIKGAVWENNDEVLVPGDANVVFVQSQISGNIVRWSIVTDGGSGDCLIDVWKDSYANFPPDVSDSIASANKPEIMAGIKAESTDFSGWSTTTVSAGDWLAFKLDSSSTFTMVQINLEIQPS